MKQARWLLLVVVALALALAGCKGGEAKKEAQKSEKKADEAQKEAPAPTPEAAPGAAEEGEEDEALEEGEEGEEGDEGEEAAGEAEEEAATPADVTERAAEKPAADEELTDTVVARVNGQDIDIKDYVERLRKLTKGKVTRSMIKKTVVDRMINEELLRQETEKLGITVTDEETAEAMNMDMERYNKQKAAMGARVEAFKERVAVRKLLQARGLLKEPSEEELKKEYARRFGLKIDAVTFPISREAAPEQREQVKAEAEKVLAAATEGVTLRAAVKDKKGPNGRRLIVKPMFIKKGDERHADLWSAADSLKEKELGGPVETPRGFVVFQLAKRIEPRKSYEEMKDKLAKSALNMKIAQAKHRLLEDLRKNADVVYLMEFTQQAELPRLRGPHGRLKPGVRPVGRDALRRPHGHPAVPKAGKAGLRKAADMGRAPTTGEGGGEKPAPEVKKVEEPKEAK